MLFWPLNRDAFRLIIQIRKLAVLGTSISYYLGTLNTPIQLIFVIQSISVFFCEIEHHFCNSELCIAIKLQKQLDLGTFLFTIFFLLGGCPNSILHKIHNQDIPNVAAKAPVFIRTLHLSSSELSQNLDG